MMSMACGAAELVVLIPVTAGNQAVMRAGPKGETQAPVFTRATNDLVTKAIVLEASRGTTKFMVGLDEQAQRIAGIRQPAPTYLLRSTEEGGFARHGFWLESTGGSPVWHTDPYVDLIVDKQSIDDGSFEEIFAHELGHVLLQRLIPRLPSGLSRAAHSSLAITDYPTAFDEGFAIHFQGLSRVLTQNQKLKGADRGLDFKPFLPFWQSNIERTLRLRGMRENVFIQHQLPALLQVGDATSLFDLTHFKNGQQMLASEGVIATLFYHLQNQALDATQLAAFYKSLLTSLRALNGQKLTAGTPLFLNLVQAHIQRVPDSRSQWLSTVLNLTYGATASNEVIRNMTNLSSLGQEGRMDEFAVALKQSRASLAAVTAQVTRNPQRLGAAVGAELWLAVKQSDGSVATINLNTAERTSLMSVLGFESGDADLLLANRTARGPFSTVDDFATRRNAPPLLRRRLKSAHDMAATLEGYQR